MERDRVEMSVGGGMVNGDSGANGVVTNGIASSSKRSAEELRTDNNHGSATNGIIKIDDDGKDAVLQMQEAPLELLEMISTEFYLPMAKLINRSAQICWNDLTDLVERWAKISVPAQDGPAFVSGMSGNQTKENLAKKDAFLNFANEHKAVFIKLLVLLQWSGKGEDVRRTIELNYWLVLRRAAFTNATVMLGQMLQDLAGAQVPNPDLYTAAEILALGRVSHLPRFDYIRKPLLTPRQMVRTLKRLNNVLCTRLSLDTTIPYQLRNFHVHDGRVTFTVEDEFELDLSLMDDGPNSKFLTVDIRFLFSPAFSIPDALHDEISFITNSAIEKGGLSAAYDFVHDLTLSYKLNELYQQTKDLAQGLWSGHLKVEMIRRTLIIQYWLKRPGPKNWIEVGVHSGKMTEPTSDQASRLPQLQLRWIRDNKLLASHGIVINLSKLSIEDTLRQVIAQHTNSLFDSIYDKFMLSPLYAHDELELEQSSSMNDTGECQITIQMSKSDYLHARIEPVSGAIIVNPVSENSIRIQGDLARSKNVIDEFVAKVSNLRCSTAQSKVLRTIVNGGWEHLEGYKPSQQELETLFAQPVRKASFLRQKHWSPQWLLVVTASNTGDHWWLVQRIRGASSAGPQLTQVLKSKSIHLEDILTPAYMERLTDFISGVIALQCNAQYLGRKGVRHILPPIPNFSEHAKLPSLRFVSLTGNSVATSDSQVLRKNVVEMSYLGLEEDSGQVICVARAQFSASVAVLKELAASPLAASVAISPMSKQVLIRSSSGAGVPVVEDVLSKLKHLNKIVACAATVRSSSHHKLQSLSLSAITILYNAELSDEYSFVINFPTESHGLEVEFLPHNKNPHQYMNGHITQMLMKKGQNLSKNLEEVLALLKMTQPLMSYLYGLQSGSLTPTGQKHKGEDDKSGNVRVHVLPRQPATFAVQYFAKTENFTRDISDSETPKRLLARIEVLPMRRGLRNLWVIRPAIEEFNSYTRPSFTSNSLRSKLKLDIFSKEAAVDWLPLDEGAACGPEHPERLLSQIYSSISQWLEEALKPEPKVEQMPNGVNGTSKPTISVNTKAQPQAKPAPAPKTLNNSVRPNGNNISGQRSGPNATQSYGGNTMSQSKMKQEVITLD